MIVPATLAIIVSILKCALATVADSQMFWFQACAIKDFEAIKSFGSRFLYEKHKEEHYQEKRVKETNFVGQNCYEMILFARDFDAKDMVILDYFVSLGMPIDNYHFQIVGNEEDMSCLVDVAENRNQELDYPFLLCLASSHGWIQLFGRLEKNVSSADVKGKIEHVYWLSYRRHSLKYKTTPVLMAARNGQLEMLDHLIRHHKVHLNPKHHPLRDAVLGISTPKNVEKMIEFLVTCGWDFEYWEDIRNHRASRDYILICYNGHDKTVAQGLERRRDLISELRNLFTFFKGQDSISLVRDNFQKIVQTLLDRGYYGSEIMSCLNHI